MSCFSCERRSWWREMSQAAAKMAAARFRMLGAAPEYRDWATRAGKCEQCPLRVLRNGVAYCGKPFLSQVLRDPTDGCGCPVTHKAKDPEEHCPLDSSHRPAVRIGGICTCKWCQVKYSHPASQ